MAPRRWALTAWRFLPDLPAVLDRRAIARRIEATSAAYDFDVKPAAPVRQLSVGERQRVEIVKDNKGMERVKAGEAFPLTDLGKMDWLVEGVIGQPR